jgi:hypothetical protein
MTAGRRCCTARLRVRSPDHARAEEVVIKQQQLYGRQKHELKLPCVQWIRDAENDSGQALA